jgi:drug/metabolite transporter (DMT)-like permease
MPNTTVIIDPTPPAPNQPYLDRKVGSSLEKFSRWKARMKSEHFTAYLSTYNGILAGVTGLFFGLVAYRLSDPMSPYRVIRRRTLQLATAIGGSLGILVAVMQVPPNAPDKVSLLLLAIAVGAVCTLIGSWIAFQVMRILSNRSARRDGRRLTDRMRHA